MAVSHVVGMPFMPWPMGADGCYTLPIRWCTHGQRAVMTGCVRMAPGNKGVTCADVVNEGFWTERSEISLTAVLCYYSRL